MAETDALTGVANRRKFTQELGQFLQLAKHNQFLCLAILDIDDFKQANDQYGYAAGTRCYAGWENFTARSRVWKLLVAGAMQSLLWECTA